MFGMRTVPTKTDKAEIVAVEALFHLQDLEYLFFSFGLGEIRNRKIVDSRPPPIRFYHLGSPNAYFLRLLLFLQSL